MYDLFRLPDYICKLFICQRLSLSFEHLTQVFFGNKPSAIGVEVMKREL